MLVTEFLEPMQIEIGELAEAMGVHRNTLSRIVHDKGMLTAPMAIKLGAALGNTPEFWLNIQHAVELWDLRHHAYEQEAKNVKRVTLYSGGGSAALARVGGGAATRITST